MAKSRFGILVYRWHAWVGLFSGLFLLVICVTGSVAVVRPEIEQAVDYRGHDFTVVPDGREPITAERAVQIAQASFPGSAAQLVRFPTVPGTKAFHGDTYLVLLNRGHGQPKVNVCIDPYRDAVIGSMEPVRGWGDWLRQLHVRFLYGSYWGRWIVGVFGLTLVFSTISGLMIFTRFNAGSWRPMLRRGRGARILTADVHKIVGLASVAFNLVFGITGAVIGLEGLYCKYVMAPATPPARLERVAELPAGMIERCVARSRELVPGGEVAAVTLAHAKTGMLRVSLETPVRHLVKEGASSVAFNAATGEVVNVYDARNASLAGRFYYAMEPLHFGRLGGAMWVKLLWGLMGLSGGFLSVTGFVIYAQAQAAGADDGTARPRRRDACRCGTGTGTGLRMSAALRLSLCKTCRRPDSLIGAAAHPSEETIGECS